VRWIGASSDRLEGACGSPNVENRRQKQPETIAAPPETVSRPNLTT